jgi:hypothetical protein
MEEGHYCIIRMPSGNEKMVTLKPDTYHLHPINER